MRMISPAIAAQAGRPLRRAARRKGLSLLEVLTALAIFFMSIVVISQMVDQASRSALKAARLAKAAVFADTVLAELGAGARALASSGQEALPDAETGWLCSIETQPESWTQLQENLGTGYGLHIVNITVVWQNAAGYPEVEYKLSRVLLDPALKQTNSFGSPSTLYDPTAGLSSQTSGLTGR
jgi:type II secretory pathway component PulJ